MLLSTIADQQIIAATAATLAWQPTDSDGEPADPGTVTVGVVRSDGTEVLAPLTATAGTGGAVRTVAVTSSHTATVDILTATWTVAAVTVAVTTHEVIGRPLLTRAEFVAREPKMSATTAESFARHRREVDGLFLRSTQRGFTPRFAVERVITTDQRLILHYPDLRAVRWARGVNVDGSTTDIDATTVGPNSAGIATLSSGSWWPYGTIEVGYEHGYDRAPFDVVGAAARYTRYVIGGGTSGVPDRATSFADGQGGVTQLATPGLGPFITGIPEVDEVLVAHRWSPALVG